MTMLLLTALIAGVVPGVAQERSIESPLNAQTLTNASSLASDARKGTIYFKLAIQESDVPKSFDTVLPGMGLGYRAAFGAHAVDLSMDGTTKQAVVNEKGEKDWNYAYNAVKANYLFYLSPKSAASLYAGAGLALAGMQKYSSETVVVPATEDAAEITTTTFSKQEFHGLVPNVLIGYEVGRDSAWRTFFQFDVSQPAIAAVRAGAFPGPAATFSIGGGF